jgi:hypothetical protein
MSLLSVSVMKPAYCAAVCQAHPKQQWCRLQQRCTAGCGSSWTGIDDADLCGVLCNAAALQIRTGKPKEMKYERS